jgi:prophage maintenance system killer protein
MSPAHFLAINGTRITADAEAAYDFIAGLYEANDFTFGNLVTGCATTSPPA